MKECGDGNSKRYGQNHVWKIASYWCDDKEKWIAFKNRETELFQILPLFGQIDFYPKLFYIENVLSAKCLKKESLMSPVAPSSRVTGEKVQILQYIVE